MPKVYNGSSNICSNTKERLFVSLTIDIFSDNVAGWILELDRGEGIPWKGNYTSWLEQKTKRMEMEEKGISKRRKTLERELEWVRMAPKQDMQNQKHVCKRMIKC
ncbi:MAG: hypothetical protein MZV49_11395 [Rhodopseudomonas palustris]|nr:hypothetical protein [Rhodopseudomonas palustris]